MKRSDYEISAGSEIFRNERYKQLESLKGIVADNKEVLGKLLSIRIPIHKNMFPEQLIDQYNIETKKYITNITTHNGLDLHMLQYNKFTKEKQMYSPYSSPGYSVYVNLLCAYYEIFKKRPILNFPHTDRVGWNKQIENHSLLLMDDMLNSYRDSYPYLHYYELFQPDKQGIHRIVNSSEKSKERTEDGFGIQGDEVILQCVDYFYSKGSRHRFFMEKELINLFLQTLIDVNRRVSGPIVNLNLKKISDVIYTLLENPQLRENGDNIQHIKTRYEELKTG